MSISTFDLNTASGSSNATTAYTEQQVSKVLLGNASVVTAGGNTGRADTLTVTIFGVSSSESLSLNAAAATALGGGSWSYDQPTGVLTVTRQSGTTLADSSWDTILNGITYTNTSDAPAASRTITFAITDTSGGGNSISRTDTVNITAVNDAPTGAVTISGTVTEDQTLTASNTLADVDGIGTIAYQWNRDGVAISGATSSTYTLGDADVGKAITVTASYTDGQGTPESVTSAATSAVGNVNDAPTGAVAIAGTATEDQILTASNTLADADGLGTIAYQWNRDGVAISGATGATYTLGDDDVGTAITVTASYTDGNGTLESITSATTSAVANVNDAPTGAVAITGSATEDQILTASNTLADADGLGTIAYQWNRDGVAISGATASTYTLGDDDVGTAITVTASYTDSHGATESETSDATATVAAHNDGAASVTISGTAEEDSVLTASVGTDPDAGTQGAATYQWNRDGVAISGATGTTYTLGDADVGKAITVTATYTDGQGFTEVVTSAATSAVANVNDAPTGAVTISGTPTEDQVLTASNTLADIDGLGTIAYQWNRDGVAISGATSSTYTLGDDDVGKAITVTASYTDGQGTPESVTSAATSAVGNVNDAPTGAVAIAGTATEDQILTASNTLADADGLGTIAYQWKRDGVAISGATGATYTLGDADVGTAITVTASYTDSNGTSESVTSGATATVAAHNDGAASVTISGAVAEDSILTASIGTDPDAGTQGAATYQWNRDGVAISGATGTTYTLGDADVGKAITVTATYTDGQGFTEVVTSAATSAVANVNDVPSGAVTISGTATEDQILTASNTLADADGLGTIAYQWNRDGVAISGATSSTYTLGDDDVGKAITVTASYTDGQGTPESVTSAATSSVANVNDAPTGAVAITGSATEDQVLTASNTLADADGLGTIAYQWNRDGVAISGATSSTYTLGDDDVGTAITVTASYTDGKGASESVTSGATAAVAAHNDGAASVTISGTAEEDSVLTASVGTDPDAGTQGAATYQWNRDGVAISGATGTTYTLGDADVGKAITVTATYTDGQGFTEVVTSAATSAVANVNDTPTGAPTATLVAGTEDTAYTVKAADLLAGFTDVDGDTLSVVNLASSTGTIKDNSNGTFTLTPGSNYNGTVTLTYDVTDQNGGNITGQTRTFSLAAVNDPAVIGGDSTGAATEDAATTTVSGTLTIGDVDSTAAFTAATIAGTYGSLAIAANGAWTYTLDNSDPDTNALAGGASVTETITVAAVDGTTKSIQITITGAEDAGSTGDDRLIGTSLVDTIAGLGGNDIIEGLGAGDKLDGGAGSDTVSYEHSAAAVIVTLASTAGTAAIVSGGDAAGDVAINFENIRGTALADKLTGNALANVIEGGGGADTLNGGGGLDTLSYEHSGAAVTVTLQTGATAAQVSGGDATGDVATNFENIRGSAQADTLTGNFSANVIDGGAGADTMTGGAGSDIYVVDNAGDVVVELAAGGTDTVQSSISYALGAYVENLTLIGSGAIDATGNSVANIIIGTSGANVIDGGAGADRMQGGGGNDTYYVDNASDVVVEAAGGGTDLVISSVSQTLRAEIENLQLTGTGNLAGTGNALDNALTGNAGNNALSAGLGNDTLMGGAGADRLTGGAGADAFVFMSASEGGDTIVDYSFLAGDRIHVSGVSFGSLSSGALDSGQFALGTLASHTTHFFYDTLVDKLYYDADAGGVGAAVLLATFSTTTTELKATDMIVI